MVAAAPVVMAAFAAALFGCREAPATRPPNILLVIADDLGVDVTHAPDGHRLAVSTPNLDRLAATGVTFTRTWANPVCSPSRATMLTGRYAFRTGVTNAVKKGRPGLPVEEFTLPEALDLAPELGYAHAAFGKWHLGNQDVGGRRAPNVAGFSHFEGSMFGANPVKEPDVNGYFRWTHVTNGRTSLCEEYRATRTVDDALAWIDARSTPWFAWFGFSLPHVPLTPPPDSLHSGPRPAAGDPVSTFRAMVEAMDTELGRLLDGVDASGEPTTVIFIGDNGTDPVVLRASGDETGRGKGLPFEPGVHVPLFIAGHGVTTPGRTCDALTNTSDLFATILDLAGVPLETVRENARERTLDSISVMPHLASVDAPRTREYLFNEVVNQEAYTFRAVRDERYKLVRRRGLEMPREWLFDLSTDPAEANDLLAVEPTRAVTEIHARLTRHLESLIEAP